MAKSGDVIENPLSGERFEVQKSTAETEGELFEGVMTIKAGGGGPPEHVHPVCEERFKVISGSMRIKIGREERIASEGDEVVVSPGTPHTFWNDGDQDARFEGQIRPALRMETFLETVFGLARDGKTNKSGMPNPLQAAVLLREYSDEIRLAGVPVFAQRLLTTLAPIGKFLGYKARYPEYSGE